MRRCKPAALRRSCNYVCKYSVSSPLRLRSSLLWRTRVRPSVRPSEHASPAPPGPPFPFRTHSEWFRQGEGGGARTSNFRCSALNSPHVKTIQLIDLELLHLWFNLRLKEKKEKKILISRSIFNSQSLCARLLNRSFKEHVAAAAIIPRSRSVLLCWWTASSSNRPAGKNVACWNTLNCWRGNWKTKWWKIPIAVLEIF